MSPLTNITGITMCIYAQLTCKLEQKAEVNLFDSRFSNIFFSIEDIIIMIRNNSYNIKEIGDGSLVAVKLTCEYKL